MNNNTENKKNENETMGFDFTRPPYALPYRTPVLPPPRNTQMNAPGMGLSAPMSSSSSSSSSSSQNAMKINEAKAFIQNFKSQPMSSVLTSQASPTKQKGYVQGAMYKARIERLRADAWQPVKKAYTEKRPLFPKEKETIQHAIDAIKSEMKFMEGSRQPDYLEDLQRFAQSTEPIHEMVENAGLKMKLNSIKGGKRKHKATRRTKRKAKKSRKH